MYVTRRHLILLMVFLVFPVALYACQADTGATVPPPDAHTQFMLGLGTFVAFLAQQIGTMLVSLWNKAGGWLDGKSNGLKMATAVLATGALGLLMNVIAQALTHQTNWIITGGLSLVFSVVQLLSAGMTITAVKSKLTTSERSSISSR